MGKVIADAGVKVFQIETTINNDTFGQDGPMSVLAKREWEWTAKDRVTLHRHAEGPQAPVVGRPGARSSRRHRAPYGVTSVTAGAIEPVHERTLEHCFDQHLVEVEGQTDILTMGLPYICPYNVNSIMNPILVMCLGLGYFFNMYRGKPLVREGGVLIMTHPTPWEFHPVHHPSYIDFFEQVLADTTDPKVIEEQLGEAVRRGRVVPPPVPDELRLPRRPPVLHVVLGLPRPQAPGPGDHRRRRQRGPCAASASSRPPRSTTPSRWPRTWSARSPPSPTSRTRRSSWPTSRDGRLR